MDSGDSNTVNKYNQTRSVKEEDQAFDMKPFQRLQQNTRVCRLPSYGFHVDGRGGGDFVRLYCSLIHVLLVISYSIHNMY